MPFSARLFATLHGLAVRGVWRIHTLPVLRSRNRFHACCAAAAASLCFFAHHAPLAMRAAYSDVYRTQMGLSTARASLWPTEARG